MPTPARRAIFSEGRVQAPLGKYLLGCGDYPLTIARRRRPSGSVSPRCRPRRPCPGRRPKGLGPEYRSLFHSNDNRRLASIYVLAFRSKWRIHLQLMATSSRTCRTELAAMPEEVAADDRARSFEGDAQSAPTRPTAKIRVVTDSAADLDRTVAGEHGVSNCAPRRPARLRFGPDVTSTWSPEEFWQNSANVAGLPETSAPSPGAFSAAFSSLADDGAEGIVCIALSSKLSATYQAPSSGPRAWQMGSEFRSSTRGSRQWPKASSCSVP